jgi:AbiU2
VSGALTIQHLISWLGTQVMFGRAHTEILRGLLRADPSVREVAPRFISMTIDAHAEESMKCLSHIFDKRSDCLTMGALLDLALAKAGTFKYGTPQQVKDFVKRSRAAISALEPSLKALRTRRNETGAHSARRPLIDPAGYIEAGKLKHKDIDRLFDVTVQILTEASQLHAGKTWDLRLPDESDYQRALTLLTRQTSSPKPPPQI